MRTTLTLDDDLARKLKDRAHRNGTSFKEVVNEILRRGLRHEAGLTKPEKKFRVETFSSDFVSGIDRGKLNQLADELEAGEFLREGIPR